MIDGKPRLRSLPRAYDCEAVLSNSSDQNFLPTGQPLPGSEERRGGVSGLGRVCVRLVRSESSAEIVSLFGDENS